MADSVIVEPKPASESSVISLNKKLAWASVLIPLGATAIEIILAVAGSPDGANAIASFFPVSARVAVLTILPIALKAISDRKKTVAPIAETPAAAELPKA